MGSIIFGIVLIAFGAFIIYDVKTEGTGDMKTAKGKMMVKILGEKGASVFYSVLGVIVILCGIGIIAGRFIGK